MPAASAPTSRRSDRSAGDHRTKVILVGTQPSDRWNTRAQREGGHHASGPTSAGPFHGPYHTRRRVCARDARGVRVHPDHSGRRGSGFEHSGRRPLSPRVPRRRSGGRGCRPSPSPGRDTMAGPGDRRRPIAGHPAGEASGAGPAIGARDTTGGRRKRSSMPCRNSSRPSMAWTFTSSTSARVIRTRCR